MDLTSKYIDVLLDMHKYDTDRGADHLEYRDKFSQMMLYLYSALFTIIFTLALRPIALPFAILLITLSKFSQLLILKFYERSEFHFTRAKKLREEIDKVFSKEFNTIHDIFDSARLEHQQKFKISGYHGLELNVLEQHIHSLSVYLHKIFLIVGVCFVLAIMGSYASCRYAQVCIWNEQSSKTPLGRELSK